ncbi:DUF2630 family protein [Streptomyces sp. ODS28]|uniref:DUF2630 family protein n=1 Tax=Streptomyces sp. ODS28 TaxID=3136688 RepID=UPI0031E65FA4
MDSEKTGDAATGGRRRILDHVTELVDEERRLREQLAEDDLDASSTDRLRLDALERELDQCWDLLRQRNAKIEYGEDPEEAAVRPASEVEGYLS